MSATLEDVRALAAKLPADLQRELGLAMLGDVRDTAWKDSSIGGLIVRYLQWKRVECGSVDTTIADKESVLVKFALDYKTRELAEFNGDDGTAWCRDFIARHWGDKAPGTRSNRTSIMRDFFAWAYREGIIDRDPMLKIRTPRRKGTRRDAHSKQEIMKLITAQPRWRDRLAVALLGREGLRKTELRLFQLGHFDFANRSASIFGKGDKYWVFEPFPDLIEDFERYCQERAVLAPDSWRREYLLFPEHAVRYGEWPNYQYQTLEYRHRAMSTTTLHRWWKTCLDRAGLPDFPMHELRHSAGTHFHIAVGDYELTRQFLRHENIATTATYIHVPNVHVSQAKKRMPSFWED